MADEPVLAWLHLSRNVLEVELETDDGLPLDGADVEATIVDALLGTEVTFPGSQWPVTLDEESPGFYTWTSPADLGVVEGRFYKAKIKAVAAGSGAERYGEPILRIVVDRT